MSDMREAIMLRLEAIAATVEGIRRVGRNVIDPGDGKVPAIFLLEGDEEANEDDPPRHQPTSTRRVIMTPQLVIVQGAAVAEIGLDLNTLRRRLIKAVLMDPALAALTIDKRGLRYVGSQTDLAFGRQMQGQMAVMFGLTYWLAPLSL